MTAPAIHVNRVVISSLHRRAGKTTVSLCLAAALQSQRTVLQPFKVGPDVVDALDLARITHRPTPRIDSWVLDARSIINTVESESHDADIALIDGAMGLFDTPGHRIAHDQSPPFAGSTFEIAEVLGASILMVIDMNQMAETSVAGLMGLRGLAPHLQCCGVVINNISDPAHASYLEDLIWERAHLPVVARLPHLPVPIVAEEKRLTQRAAGTEWIEHVEEYGQLLIRNSELDLLTRQVQHPIEMPMQLAGHRQLEATTHAHIAVAFDDAFCATIEDNVTFLRQAGGEIEHFSPLSDEALPHGTAAVYLGGPIAPEYIGKVMANSRLLESLSLAHRKGLPIYAEAGGAILFARSIMVQGATYAGLGIIPVDIAVLGSSLQWRHILMKTARDSFLGITGTELKGYTAHETRIVTTYHPEEPVFTTSDAGGNPLGPEGWIIGSLTATLLSVHFGQDPSITDRFLAEARAVSSGLGVTG